MTIAFEFNPRAGDDIPNIVDKSKISVSTREAYEVLKIMAQEALQKTGMLDDLAYVTWGHLNEFIEITSIDL